MAVVAVTGQSLGFHRSGQLRIPAVTSPKHLVAAPELPTVAHAGFPGLTSQQHDWACRSARTPKPIIELIAQAVRKALCGICLRTEIDRFRVSSKANSPYDAREIPASPRSRYCFLDAGGRSARGEDRLTKAR